MDTELAAVEGGKTPAPFFISLENHCTPPVQLRLAKIMHEEFGDKLVTEQIHEDGTIATLDELAGRIMVMVEYYGLNRRDVPEDPESSDSDEESKKQRERKEAAKPAKIIPELASLGVYAQSMKPADDAWLTGKLTEPKNHLVNVEERAVKALIEAGQGEGVAKHNAEHLMRIYPKGTRIGELGKRSILMYAS